MPRSSYFVSTALSLFVTGVICAWGVTQVARAAQDSQQGTAQQASPEQVRDWIRQLDADDFQSREAASDSLLKAGAAAVEQLTTAAQGESLEVTTRAMDILTRLYEKSEGETKEQLKSALEQIAQGSNKAAAGRADQVLNPPQPPQPPQPFGGRVGGFNIVMGGAGNMQIQSSTDANGNKTINATEGDRKVDISEKADGSIKMTVKEQVDGKEVSKEYSAKDKAELKEKHAEAFALYEKYSQQMGGIIALPAQIAGRMQIMPAMPAFRVVNPAVQAAAVEELQKAQDELKAATAELRKLTESGTGLTAEAVGELLKKIEAAEAKIREATEKLSK